MRWLSWTDLFRPHKWTWRRLLGNRSERIAAKHLRSHGLRVVARNIEAPGLGEIDILAREGDTLVVVEVRSRRVDDAQIPLDSVAYSKRQRILAATRWLVRRHNLVGINIRQDIVAIAWSGTNQIIEIRHIRNAFGPDGNSANHPGSGAVVVGAN